MWLSPQNNWTSLILYLRCCLASVSSRDNDVCDASRTYQSMAPSDALTAAESKRKRETLNPVSSRKSRHALWHSIGSIPDNINLCNCQSGALILPEKRLSLGFTPENQCNPGRTHPLDDGMSTSWRILAFSVLNTLILNNSNWHNVSIKQAQQAVLQVSTLSLLALVEVTVPQNGPVISSEIDHVADNIICYFTPPSAHSSSAPHSQKCILAINNKRKAFLP